MKRRARKVLNFFAFNLLFFALYLNFIHKDKTGVETVPVQTNTSSISGTILVQNPEKYLERPRRLQKNWRVYSPRTIKSTSDGLQVRAFSNRSNRLECGAQRLGSRMIGSPDIRAFKLSCFRDLVHTVCARA